MNLKQWLRHKKEIIITFFLLFSVIAVFLIVSNIDQITKLISKAAEEEAIFIFGATQINLQYGEIQSVDVFLDPSVGIRQGNVNGIEFKITFDSSKVAIVDSSGNPVSQIALADASGEVFQGLNTFVAQNSISNGEIYLSVAIIPGGSQGDSYSGDLAKAASFYIKALTNSGSTSLEFLPVEPDSATDFMHAYHKDEEPPYPDILSASKMNGASTSRINVDFGGAAVPSFFLSTPVLNLKISDTFAVKIELDTAGQDIIGVDAALEYNSDILSLESITPGSIFASYEGLEVPAQGGVVGFTVSGYSLPGGNPPPPYNSETNPDHVFANLNFKTLNPGNTEIRFRFDGYQQSTTDSNILSYLEPGQQATNADDILEAVHNLSLNISAQPSPPPSISPLPTPPPSLGPSPYPSPTPPPPSPSPSYWPWTPPSPSPFPSIPDSSHPSPSPEPSYPNQTILRVKFAGVPANNNDFNLPAEFRSQNLKVTVVNKNSGKQEFSKKLPFIYDSTTQNWIYFSEEKSGLDLASLSKLEDYIIKIKGPQHRQLVFCQDGQASKTCQTGEGLKREDNDYDFNFSGYPLEFGDYNLDGSVGVNDWSAIVSCRNRNASKGEEIYNSGGCKEADANWDGEVNNFDIDLLYQTLSSKPDDE